MAKRKCNDFGVVYKKDDRVTMEILKGELEDLMFRYHQRRVRTYELSWLMDLMSTARKFGFNQLSSWDGIRQSPYIYGQNLAFLDDSMAFALGGDRDMSISTWMELIDWVEDRVPVAERGKASNRAFHCKLANVEETSGRHDLIERWCRREHGPADMLCTLYALFCGNPFRV